MKNLLRINATSLRREILNTASKNTTSNNVLLDVKVKCMGDMIDSADEMEHVLELIKTRCNQMLDKIRSGDDIFNPCGLLQGLEAKLDRQTIKYATANEIYNIADAE